MYWSGISNAAIAAQAIGIAVLLFVAGMFANRRARQTDATTRHRTDAYFDSLVPSSPAPTPNLQVELLSIDQVLKGGAITVQEREHLRLLALDDL